MVDLSALTAMASGSLRLSATGDLAPEAVWERYTQPVWWPIWAPHLREVDYPDAVVRPGTTGRVTGAGPRKSRVSAVQGACDGSFGVACVVA